MREKLETIALPELKKMAKERGIKGVSTMNKSQVIDAILEDVEANTPKEEAETSSAGTETAPEAAVVIVKKKRGRPRKADLQAAEEKAEEKSHEKPVEKTEVKTKAEADAVTGTKSEAAADAGDEKKAETASDTGSGTGDEAKAEGKPENSDRQVHTADNAHKEKTSGDLDSGQKAHGILEVMPDGYGFIRCENYLPGENDVYVAPSQIRRFNLKTGDILEGNTRIKTQQEKFSALLYVKTVNGYDPETAMRRPAFENLTPIFPDSRFRLETPRSSVAMRIMDLVCPVGRGQRGMIVSPPKAGKTTLLKDVAKSIKVTAPSTHLIILLIDERPEEVTDIKEALQGPNVEIIYSTFDELPEHHKRVSEMVIERAKRLVEHGKDVMILLDSITRLTRAYNLTVPPSGRTLSGGLDPAALYMPKRFFGAARNMREGGSLTILATALIETGSKMDDVVYEEFKGTGNMEMVLDRKLSEKRIFPAIDIPRSSTRREDLLLEPEELEAMNIMRKTLNGLKPEEAVDRIIDRFTKTRSNEEFVRSIRHLRYI